MHAYTPCKFKFFTRAFTLPIFLWPASHSPNKKKHKKTGHPTGVRPGAAGRRQRGCRRLDHGQILSRRIPPRGGRYRSSGPHPLPKSRNRGRSARRGHPFEGAAPRGRPGCCTAGSCNVVCGQVGAGGGFPTCRVAPRSDPVGQRCRVGVLRVEGGEEGGAAGEIHRPLEELVGSFFSLIFKNFKL
jgi:hypothetical protein